MRIRPSLQPISHYARTDLSVGKKPSVDYVKQNEAIRQNKAKRDKQTDRQITKRDKLRDAERSQADTVVLLVQEFLVEALQYEALKGSYESRLPNAEAGSALIVVSVMCSLSFCQRRPVLKREASIVGETLLARTSCSKTARKHAKAHNK